MPGGLVREEVFGNMLVSAENAVRKLPEAAAERFARLRAALPDGEVPVYAVQESLKGVDLELLV